MSGSHISRLQMDCALDGFLTTRREQCNFRGQALPGMGTGPVSDQSGHRAHRESGRARCPVATGASIVSTGDRARKAARCQSWQAGWAPRPSATGVGTVPTGNRSEHCVHWRPGMPSCTMPIEAGGMGTVPIGNQGGHGAHWQPKRALCALAARDGKWHDADLGGWNGHGAHRQSGWARCPLTTEASIVCTGGRGWQVARCQSWRVE